MKSRGNLLGRRSKQPAGLRVVADRACRETRKPILRFAKWLRVEYEFPIQVVVRLLPGETFQTMDRLKVVASFRYPASRKDRPLIRLATGDYPSLKAARGRDDALAAILASLARQVARYQMWVTTGTDSDKGIGPKANGILRRYQRVVARP